MTMTQKQSSLSTEAPATGVLSKISVLGYGAGGAANNLAFTTATMFLLVYYTDVAGISAAAGTLLLLSVATFSIPQIGESGMLLWAYISYALLGLAYSFVNMPYGSLAGAMTQNSGERAKLASAGTIGAVAVGSFLGIFIAPLMKGGENLQPLFTTLTIIFAVVGTGLYMFTVFSTKERVVREVSKVSMKQSIDTLKGNKPLLLLCISSFLFLTGQLARRTSTWAAPCSWPSVDSPWSSRPVPWCGSPSPASSSRRWACCWSACWFGHVRLTPLNTASGGRASAPKESPTHCSPSPARLARPSVEHWLPLPSPGADTPPAQPSKQIRQSSASVLVPACCR